MKRTVSDELGAENLISRVDQLTTDAMPLWGKMNPTEMLLHCNATNQAILNWEGKIRKATFRQKLAKFVWMNLMPNFPKNVKGVKKFDMKGLVDSGKFEEERKTFIDLLRQFPMHQKPLISPHPFFGPLNTAEWGKVIWKHLDHHLRQFGV
ncbi:DUF1569 domain-containing protein [Lunatibacter salilacus]|uniref:DUF1569 domain-containing protein n=1 Tax=Lunatibacter salilacus TaxID=2483804 RepID=UPI00131C54EF|nr:DUF1569 domain-containing protein [Lunatibacter salilacus]